MIPGMHIQGGYRLGRICLGNGLLKHQTNHWLFSPVCYVHFLVVSHAWEIPHKHEIPPGNEHKSLVVFSSMLCSFPGGISCLWGISQAWIDVDPVCLFLVFSRVRMHTLDWMLDPPALLVENTAGAPRRNQQRGEGAARLGPCVSVSKMGDTWMRKVFQLGKEWQVNNHWILYINIIHIYIYQSLITDRIWWVQDSNCPQWLPMLVIMLSWWWSHVTCVQMYT